MHLVERGAVTVRLSLHEVTSRKGEYLAEELGPEVADGLTGDVEATSTSSGTIDFSEELLIGLDVEPGDYALKVTAIDSQPNPFKIDELLGDDEFAGVRGRRDRTCNRL